MDLDNIDFKVFVRCFTYNQSRYINQTLEGFCMQETDFPFICAIVDDASTDGEQEVINDYVERNFDNNTINREEKEYASIITARHKKNTNCFFVVLLLKENHYHKIELRNRKLFYLSKWRDMCQYESICEGDDFWIVSNKLQSQYDYLQSNPNYSMVFCAINLLYPDGTIKEEHRYSKDNYNCDIKDCILCGGGYAKLAAMMFVIGKEEYNSWYGNRPVGDAPMQLSLFTRGKVMYIDKITSCYRINAVGSWSQATYSSFKTRFKHNKRVTDRLILFDKYTQNKYHAVINKTIVQNYINLLPKPVLIVYYGIIKCLDLIKKKVVF